MIAHKHDDIKFSHYAHNLYPADSNHTIGSFARLLHNLEKLPSYFSRLLSENTNQHLYMKRCWMEKIYACICCQSHLVNLWLSWIFPPLCVSNWTIVPRTIKIDIFLHIGHCCLQKTFSRRCLCLSFGRPLARWYWCIFWAIEHKVARGGFSNNPTIDEIIYEFGKHSCHPPYDWGGAWFQGIYRTVYLKWSSPIDQAYKGTTIPVLHAWWRCPSHAIQVIVHNTRLKPTRGSLCMACWCRWKDDVTGRGA